MHIHICRYKLMEVLVFKVWLAALSHRSATGVLEQNERPCTEAAGVTQESQSHHVSAERQSCWQMWCYPRAKGRRVDCLQELSECEQRLLELLRISWVLEMCRQAAAGALLSWGSCQEAVTGAWAWALPHQPRPLSLHKGDCASLWPLVPRTTSTAAPGPSGTGRADCCWRRALPLHSEGPQRCSALKWEDSWGAEPAGFLLCSAEQSSEAQRLIPTCHFPSWGHGAVSFSVPINFHCCFRTVKAWGKKVWTHQGKFCLLWLH